jgi:hypothetical protein
VDECSGPLLGKSGLFEKDCFAETFLLAEGGKEILAKRLQPLLNGHSGIKLHVTGLQIVGAAYQVKGYIEGSALGDLRLPDSLHIVKERGDWKWYSAAGLNQTDFQLSKNIDRSFFRSSYKRIKHSNKFLRQKPRRIEKQCSLLIR